MNSQVAKYGLFVIALIVALLTALGVELPALGDDGQAAVVEVANAIGLAVKLWQNGRTGRG